MSPSIAATTASTASSLSSSLPSSSPPTNTIQTPAQTIITTNGTKSRVSSGLVAGLATAGGLLIIALIALAYHYGTRRRRRTALARETFANDPLGKELYTQPELGYRQPSGNDAYSTPTPTYTSAGVPGSHSLSAFPTPPATAASSVGVQRDRDGEIRKLPDVRPRRRSLPNPATSTPPRLTTNTQVPPQQQPPSPPSPTGHIDITALAAEVASVLLHTPPKPAAAPSPSSPRPRLLSSLSTRKAVPRTPDPDTSLPLSDASIVGMHAASPSTRTNLGPNHSAMADTSHGSGNSTSQWYDRPSPRTIGGEDDEDEDEDDLASLGGTNSAAPPYTRSAY